MVEWWVSQKKNWCEICRVWTGGHMQQILKHKNGRMHNEHEEKMLKDARQREVDRLKDKKDVLDELAKIERAALAAMAASSTSYPSAATAAVTGAGPGGSAQLGVRELEREVQKRQIELTVDAAKRRRSEDSSRAAADSYAGCPWTRHKDPGSGQFYYYNASAGQSSWQEPPEFAAAAASANSAVVAPATDAAALPHGTPAGYGQANAVVAPTTMSSVTSVGSGDVGGSNASTLGRTAAHVVPVAAVQGVRVATILAEPAAPLAVAPAAGHAMTEQVATAAMPVIGGTPSGGPSWVVCTDPTSGHVYYFNSATGMSSWERPPNLPVDLSRPPPPPSQKPPPPPERRRVAVGGVGAWEEVSPQDSMFGSTEVQRRADANGDDDVDAPPNPFAEVKFQLMGCKGTFGPEDLELREKEVFNKRSNAVLAADEQPEFPTARKKASGIRKRGGGEGE